MQVAISSRVRLLEPLTMIPLVHSGFRPCCSCSYRRFGWDSLNSLIADAAVVGLTYKRNVPCLQHVSVRWWYTFVLDGRYDLVGCALAMRVVVEQQRQREESPRTNGKERDETVWRKRTGLRRRTRKYHRVVLREIKRSHRVVSLEISHAQTTTTTKLLLLRPSDAQSLLYCFFSKEQHRND